MTFCHVRSGANWFQLNHFSCFTRSQFEKRMKIETKMLKTLQNLEASNNREQKLVQIRHFLFSFSSVEQNIMNLTAVRCVFSLSFPKSEKSFSLHNKFHPRKDTRRHTDAITESASLSTSFSRSSSSSTSSSSFLLLFWFAFRRYSGFVRSVTKTKKKFSVNRRTFAAGCRIQVRETN